MPPRATLFDPTQERDACGIGFVADSAGRASRGVVDAVLEGLYNVRHRGATAADRKTGSLPSQIKIAAKRQNVPLPDGWKASAALHLVATWAEQNTMLPGDVLDRAAALFAAAQARLAQLEGSGTATGTPAAS